jgi:TPR repeat protein
MRLAVRHVLVILLLLFMRTASAAERPWLEVKSPHFTILTDGDVANGREVAWQFEQMRAALAKLLPWAKLTTDKPVLVLAARDQATLKTLAPVYWEKGHEPIISVAVDGADRHYLAMRTDERMTDDVRITPYFNLYRGYLHVVLDASFERPLPLWLERGMAELFGNLRVRDKDLFLGRMIPWHIEQLRRTPPMPLETLLGAERSSPVFQQGEARRRFDAQSWVFLHYLMFGDEGAHGPQINRFFSLVAQGATPDVARRDAFPDLATLAKGFDTYLWNPGISYRRVGLDVDIAREEFPSRPVPPAESKALRASFHVAMQRPNEARALIQEAKAADPAFPGAYDAEGLLAHMEDKDDAARAALAKAMELGSTSYFTWYQDARLAQRGGTDPAFLARMEKSLQRALDLNTNFAAGYSYLAETKLSLGRKDDAFGLVKRAVSLEPGGSYHHATLARVLAEQGKAAEAQAEAQRASELAREDWEKENARRVADYVSKRTAAPAAAATAAGASQPGEDPDALSEACFGSRDAASCAKLVPVLERYCTAGDGSACSALAWILESGTGVPADLTRAAAFYQQSCEKKDQAGCVRFAWLQARGEGVPKDEAGGMAALDRICSEGFLEACTQLGVLHAGRQTSDGMARARELLKKACDGKDAEACRLLSSMPR